MMVDKEKATNEEHTAHPLKGRPSGVFLNVGIVGAGIAGLAAAAALSRIGHNVEVGMPFCALELLSDLLSRNA